MSLDVTAESPARPVTLASEALRPRPAPIRLVLLALGAVAIFLAIILIAFEVAAARAPEHRAALEELIRHETGLEVSFSELSLGWGWHGPEAVFQAVVLGEPGGGALLRAPRLSVALDLWRMARSGRLEAGRITLQGADIDLTAASAMMPAATGAAAPSAEVSQREWSAGARILAHWRGGVIEIDRGSVRGMLPGVAGLLTVRHALLRRVGADWNADARVLLPESLGASARLTLWMSGDLDLPASVSGTLRLEAERIEVGGWRTLASSPAQRYLPQAGSGNFGLRLSFAGGRLLAASGTVHAEGLEWAALAPSTAPLTLERLRCVWQLSRRDGEWRVGISRLETAVDAPAPQSAMLFADVASDGTHARGYARNVPLAALALLARGSASAPILGQLAVEGVARELRFDFNAQRPAGTRLMTHAELSQLTVGTSAGEVRLSGLSGLIFGTESHLQAMLDSQSAQLAVSDRPGGEQPVRRLEGVEVAARLALDLSGAGGWQLRSEDLQLRHAGADLTASGSIGAAAPTAVPRVSAHVAVRDADIATLSRLFGPETLSALGPVASRLTGGRIESAELTWRADSANGLLRDAPGGAFTGVVALRAVSLDRDELWPQAEGIDARILWRGPRVQAVIEHAQSGSFRLSDGRIEWDARAAHAFHFGARLAGSAEEAVGWLRAHPQLATWSAAAASLDLRGDTVINVDLTVPAVLSTAGNPSPPRVRVAATLDGARLRVLPGLPPIESLRGSLAASGGHLERSTFSGQWLGGPVSLAVGEHSEQGLKVLTISGRGAIGAREAVQAAGGDTDEARLAGSAEWSALLAFFPDPREPLARWHLHADSGLVGVTSRLPEPFAKGSATPLPLHVDVQGGSESGQVRVSLGDRMQAAAALMRSGDGWRIARSAIRLAGNAPALPADPVLRLDGRLRQLDLAAALGLWRAAGRDAALPEVRADLSVAQLLVGDRRYADVDVAGGVADGGGVMELHSAGLIASARWPGMISREHPAEVHVAGFEIDRPDDLALAAGLAAVLAPAAEVSIDELQWQGHRLGRFAAALASDGATLEVSELALVGAAGDVRAHAHCTATLCRAGFALASADAAASLMAFGLRPEVSATDARLEGEVQWAPQAPVPLATLDGHLHMELSSGLVHAAGGAVTPGTRFALLSVPALLASAPAGAEAPRALGFAKLTGDFEVRDGQATTSGLHFDGDAEILVRGRVGLSSGDYDEQAWILSGEERLPAPLRRLSPTPRVAALWLSLREWLGNSSLDRSHTALHLQGPWNDPVVTPAE
jgi:uncharacterized protein YhdP